MVFHPGVALGRVFPHRFGHAFRMRRNCPAPYRHPGPVFLSDQLVDRYVSGLAHQVVHRRTQRQGGLVSDPVEGIRSDVLVDHLFRFRFVSLSQPNESIVGVRHVYRPLCRTVEVVQLVRYPVLVLEGDLVDFDFCDFHGNFLSFIIGTDSGMGSGLIVQGM